MAHFSIDTAVIYLFTEVDQVYVGAFTQRTYGLSVIAI